MSLYEQTVGLHLFLKASDLKDLKLNFNEKIIFTIQYFVYFFLNKLYIIPRSDHAFQTWDL